jgi:hypothetical protein
MATDLRTYATSSRVERASTAWQEGTVRTTREGGRGMEEEDEGPPLVPAAALTMVRWSAADMGRST